MTRNISKLEWLAAFLALTLALFVCPVLAASTAESPESSPEGLPNLKHYKGRVLTVETVTSLQDPTLPNGETKQISQIQFVQGPFKGRIYPGIVNYIRKSDPQQIYLEVDDLVIVSAELTDSGDNIKNIYVSSYYRAGMLSAALALTALALAAVCWVSGARGALALAAFGFLAVFGFIPLMLRGVSPILLSLPLALAVGAILIFGELKRTPSGASAYAAFGISNAVAALCGLASEKAARLTGLGESELSMLLYMRNHSALDYSGLVFAAVMLASCAAVCDVAISAVAEVHSCRLLNPYISKRELFLKGFSLCQPKAARVACTLFLAMSASVLPVWALYASYGTSLMQLANMESISIQFFRAAAAMSGALVCLPISCLICTLAEARHSVY
jgi:uncharacterized membrane protein